MKNNFILLICFGLLSFNSLAQNASDCVDGQNGCDAVTNGFPVSTSGFGNVDELGGNSVSNPTTNPNISPGNAGCLLAGELNSTWITIYVNGSGTLEFTLGAANSNGFLDWAMWDNTNGNACTDIAGNTLPPVACNWNASSSGFTGMADPANLPVGAMAGNFEDPLNVTAGQSFTIMFSNYSGITAALPMNFIGSGSIGCTGTSSEMTICLGDTAQFDMSNILPANTSSAIITPNVSTLSNFPILEFWPTADSTDYVIDYTSPDSIWTDTITVFVNQPLNNPDAGVDDSACLGGIFNLVGTGNNTTAYYTWDHIYPPGVTSGAFYLPNNQGLSVNILTAQAGPYQFILSAVDSFAVCPNTTDTVNLLISLENHTAALIDPSCFGYNDGQITIYSTGTIGASEFSIDNGVTFQVSNVFAGLTSGSYDIVSRDPLGCTFTSNVVLTDPLEVILTVSPNDIVCENGTALLTANAINGNSFNYYWDFTSDTLGSQNLSPIADSTVTVFALNENNCSSDTLSIFIGVRDPITLSITPNDTLCPHPSEFSSLIVVSPTGGYQGYTYSWTANGGTTTYDDDSLLISPVVETEYCVTVDDGCETTPKTACATIAMHTVPIPQFTSDTIAGCVSLEVNFVNTTNNVLFGSNDDVKWIMDGKTYKNQTGIKHTFNSVGDFDVYLNITSIHGCHDDILLNQYIHVHPIPEPKYYVSPDPASIYSPVVQLINLTDGSNNTYNWEMPAGSPNTSIDESPTVTYQEGLPNKYPTKLTVTSEFNCVNSTEVLVHVVSDVNIYAPNTFTPGVDNINNTWRVYIEGINNYDFKLQIYNRWGGIVWESRDPSAEWDGTMIDGSLAQDGTYAWVLSTKDLTLDKRYEFRGTINIFR